MNPWPLKTSATILCLAAILAALGFIPAFEQFQVLRPGTLNSVFEFRGHDSVALASASGAYGQLIDRGRALDPFFRALARAENREPGAIVQILHFGDSPITADQISADVRTLLQKRFGDAGEGFVLIAKPWPWYNHRGIGMSNSGWTVKAASQNYAEDGLHGLGGATFLGSKGASARFQLPGAQQRVEILYRAQPGGGSLEVFAGAEKLAEIATDSSVPASAFRDVRLPSAARKVGLRVTSGQVRLFGVSFEKDGPGVRYHSLGLNAAQIQVPLRRFEPKHWAEQIRHQRPDLIVINYGTNESGYPGYIDGPYSTDLRELVGRVQAAAPEASILIMSPMDRGMRNSRGGIETMPKLAKLVQIQRSVAAELGCAFFNTFQAMGGDGAMARWYAARPRLASADFMHPLPAGAARVGGLLEAALYQGYLNFKAASVREAAALGGH